MLTEKEIIVSIILFWVIILWWIPIWVKYLVDKILQK